MALSQFWLKLLLGHDGKVTVDVVLGPLKH